MACVLSYRWADGLFPVSDSLLETTNTYAFSPPKSLGLNSQYLPYKSAVVIPNGFDATFWKRTASKEANTFITVSGPSGYALKGLDLFLDLAKSRPEDRFRIAGIGILDNCPPNVELLGYLTREELRDQFSQAQFFCQLSIWEGFGCALCEAMLCECIPIVSDVNMLPEIVGDLGIVLPKRDAALLQELVSEVSTINSGAVRQRIIDNYPIKSRIEILTTYCQSTYF
jgi:glycosyltransferase involved in cell wall biosynthesis